MSSEPRNELPETGPLCIWKTPARDDGERGIRAEFERQCNEAHLDPSLVALHAPLISTKPTTVEMVRAALEAGLPPGWQAQAEALFGKIDSVTIDPGG